MRNGLKRAAAFALTILMLLTLLPAALATEVHSDGVVPGLSDGGELAGLLDAANSSDETVSANALLAAYGGISALAEGEVIGEQYYTITVDGTSVDETPQYKVEGSFKSGDLPGAVVPTVTPVNGDDSLEFVGAYINSAEVTYVGTLTHGDTTYVYYTTADNDSSLAATVLGEGEQIELRYTAKKELVITYTLSGETTGLTEDGIFGADRPTTVYEGENYNVTVRIPRGYKATVMVNGKEAARIGEGPTYHLEEGQGGKEIKEDDDSRPLSLEHLVEVPNASGEQEIEVELSQEMHEFSAELVVQTRFFSDGNTPRGDFGEIERSFSSVSEGHWEKLWSFTSYGLDSVMWTMDSLQINGEQLNIPYASSNGRSATAETTLSSGTKVRLSVTVVGSGHRYPSREYTLSVSNCYEDITISGGNLNNAASWNEIIPSELVGVDLYLGADMHRQSKPFSVGNSGTDYVFGNSSTIRFKLQNGYTDPTVEYKYENGRDVPGKYVWQGPRRVWRDSFTLTGPDNGGWYYITINDVDQYDDTTFTFLHITAEVAEYSVTYGEGEQSVSLNLPAADDRNGQYYDIVNAANVPVSNLIPVAQNAEYVFSHWELKDYESKIQPGDVLSLETVAQYAVEQNGRYVLPLVAVWTPVDQAKFITYQVQFRLDGTNEGTPYSFQTAVGENGKVSVVIREDDEAITNFLANHTGYQLDPVNEYVHNEVGNNDILYVNFVKATTDVTIAKLVTGNMGDRLKAFGFTVQVMQDGKPVILKAGNDYAVDSDGDITFSLANEDRVTLQDVPIGATLTITEEGADTYTVTATGAKKVEGQAATFTATVSEGMGEITVKNEKEARPDTGIVTDSLPYIVILACVVAIGAVVIVRRRGRRDE